MAYKKKTWKSDVYELFGMFLISFNVLGWLYFLKFLIIDFWLGFMRNHQWKAYESMREHGHDIEWLRSIAFIVAPYILLKLYLGFGKEEEI